MNSAAPLAAAMTAPIAWPASSKAVDSDTTAPRGGHHGPVAGAELDEADLGGRAEPRPDLRGPQAQQLAEHLRDVRGGDEVALGAQARVGGVVAVLRVVQAAGHEPGDRHRPV